MGVLPQTTSSRAVSHASRIGRRPRVKLITLPWTLEVPTLSLASLAAVTPREMEVAIVDVLREPLILDEPVDLVGITASTARIKAAYALADLFRARGAVVVLGGHHATALPDEALEHADAVVCGEGDLAWQRICYQVLSNPSLVGGIYRDPLPDLTALPLPRTDLMHLERYSPYAFPVIASRGCPFRCTFCFSKVVSPTYRTFPVARVLEQLRRRPPQTRAFYFVDDNLTAEPDFARELFGALRRERIPFVMQSRIEVAEQSDLLRLAHDAGCVAISSGYESVSQASLESVAKRTDAQDYREASRLIFEAGIVPSGNWMFGFDGDDPDCFNKTLAFLDDSWVLDASFTVEIPFPGTTTFERYRREGRILIEDYDEYIGKDHVVYRPARMTPAQLRDGIRWLARKYYSPERLARRARLVLSNPRVLDAFDSRIRPAVLALHAGRQALHWHSLMTPAWERLRRVRDAANKWRYPGALLHGTNLDRSVEDMTVRRTAYQGEAL